jgi:Kef-type K+ transport system membrane component KefB
MSPFLQLAFELLIILLAAKAAGYLSTRLGQPAVLGELLVGVLLGPSLLDISHLAFINSADLSLVLSDLAEMGVILLMFLAGLELHLRELAGHLRTSLLASLGGLLFSITMGWGAGRLFGMQGSHALFLGLALGATSVSISARTMMEMGALRSRVGLSLLGAAVVDDILAIICFSVFMAVTSGSSSAWELVWMGARMFLFLVVAASFGYWVLPRLVRWVGRLSISQGVLALALVVLLAYSVAAEALGQMAALIGAFLAGLMFARTPEKGQIEQGVNSLAYGLFVPVFFVNIGMTLNLRLLQWNAVWLVVVVTLAAVFSKLAGAAGGAALGGLRGREALQVGAGMVPRGEVSLILAAAGLATQLLDQAAFSAVVIAVLFTSLLTPILLRLAFGRQKAQPEASRAQAAGEKEEQKT